MYYANFAYCATILVLGDSLSSGYGFLKKYSWVNLMADKLHDDGYDINVSNASVAGATTSDGLDSLAWNLSKYQPNILIVALGSNDGLRGMPIDLIVQNLSNIIIQAEQSQVKVLLIGFKLPPNYGVSYTKAFADIFPKLSKEYDIPLVPFLLEGFALDAKYFQKDRVHPTVDAQPLMLQNVWPYLVPMLKDDR